ncbi:MAG TPA: hypothetical protein VN635_00770 [Conexibacter sp.]|nr:hypothetical protein [Conexibacter sp.]
MTLSAADLAWLLALPLLALAVPLVALLAAPLGHLAFPRPGFHYWAPQLVVRKPATQAGYVLGVAFALAYGGAIVVVARRRPRMRPGLRRAALAGAQALLVAFVLVCWIAQWRLVRFGGHRVYFTAPTIIVAVLLAAGLASLARSWDGERLVRLRARLSRRPSPAALRAACLAAALLAVVTWLLPSVWTDHGMSVVDGSGQLAFPAELFGNGYYFDEANAVLDGRSPLVNMPAYGELWPYAIALPFAALGATYAAFTALMAAVTGVGLLAVYGVMRRLAGSLLGLALFLPFVATSFFIELGDTTWRYSPGSYYGVFPLRYAGPYLLAWLTLRHAERARPRRAGTVLLFLAGGLVLLNNLDFGAAGVAGTLVALAIARRPPRLRLLAVDAGAGLALALALVSALTLARAGTLPHLGELVRYGRVFVDGGYGNVALRGLGWHVVLTLTFLGALATAAVRVAHDAPQRPLTAMLAWSGVFGLGASAYFYAYRSHPDVLLDVFSAWGLALALLTLVVLRSERARRGLPAAPALLVLLGFGLTVCSLAQVPRPWSEVRRIASPSGVARPLALATMADVVRERTRPHEPVVILSQVGHRVAREAGVVNVAPYPGAGQMPSREQLDETLALLRREGGRTIFVAQQLPLGMGAYLRRRGYVQVGRFDEVGWLGSRALELRYRPAAVVAPPR